MGERTLVFAIAALDLLVHVLLHVSLEDACAGGLVEASGLENVGGIDPVIVPPPHNMLFQIVPELELVHGYL